MPDVLPVRDRVATRSGRRDGRRARAGSCTRTRRSGCSAAPSSTSTTAPAPASGRSGVRPGVQSARGARPRCPSTACRGRRRRCRTRCVRGRARAVEARGRPADRAGQRAASTASRDTADATLPAPEARGAGRKAPLGPHRSRPEPASRLTRGCPLGSLARRPARRIAPTSGPERRDRLTPTLRYSLRCRGASPGSPVRVCVPPSTSARFDARHVGESLLENRAVNAKSQ